MTGYYFKVIGVLDIINDKINKELLYYLKNNRAIVTYAIN
jgi:hypothetical protein